jgi:hypothetical protein
MHFKLANLPVDAVEIDKKIHQNEMHPCSFSIDKNALEPHLRQKASPSPLSRASCESREGE